MKSLGLVRKLDDYKRVPIPKEIKEILNLKKGDSLEFFKCDEGVIIRKHNPSLKEWIYGRFKYMGHMHLCNAPSVNNNYLVNLDNYIYFRWSRQANKEN